MDLVHAGALRRCSATAQPRQPLMPRRSKAPRSTARSTCARAISIDRRAHMELAWKRQQDREALLAETVASARGSVVEVQDLQHLDHLLEAAGSSLVVVLLYSRSCGACKQVISCLQTLAAEAGRQRARAVFAKHNIIDPYDYPSDISRMHKVRVVPTLVFFDDGAVVRRMTLRDVRNMHGTPGAVRDAMSSDLRRFQDTFRQMMWRAAPGARP